MKSILSTLTTVILIGLGSPAAIAQTGTNAKTDEQLLRKLIQEENEGKHVIKPTEDSIFVSGAYPRPMIGRAVQEAVGRTRDRSNVSQKGEVVRLAISQSGDMAEEFGNFTLSFDQPDKTHISFDGSYLRVWRKIMASGWKMRSLRGLTNRKKRPRKSPAPDQKLVSQTSNQAMQPTAGCSDAPIHFMKTRPLHATLALASSG